MRIRSGGDSILVVEIPFIYSSLTDEVSMSYLMYSTSTLIARYF